MDMPNFAHRRWQWQPTDMAAADRFSGPFPLISDADEQPGPDGIRWGLVNRIRAEIAAGVYDDDEKWAMAQELLFQRVGGLR